MGIRYRDELLITALESARGDDRTVLVGALGQSEGSAGPAALRALASPDSHEAGHTRAMALRALGDRVRSAETVRYAAALSDRSVAVQLAAAGVLAEHGDSRATSAVLGWLVRKLRRNGRADSWDPDEIRLAVRYADRNDVLADLARVLLEHRDRLVTEEHRWLQQVWPAALADAPSAAQLRKLDSDRMERPLFDEHRSDPNHDEAVNDLADEFVEKALTRAQRRTNR